MSCIGPIIHSVQAFRMSLSSTLPVCCGNTEDSKPLTDSLTRSRLPHDSEPAQKRPRLLDEAVKEVGPTGEVPLKFSDSFATENQSLVLLQVSWPDGVEE